MGITDVGDMSREPIRDRRHAYCKSFLLLSGNLLMVIGRQVGEIMLTFLIRTSTPGVGIVACASA
jgi:hypothetical protein